MLWLPVQQFGLLPGGRGADGVPSESETSLTFRSQLTVIAFLSVAGAVAANDLARGVRRALQVAWACGKGVVSK